LALGSQVWERVGTPILKDLHIGNTNGNAVPLTYILHRRGSINLEPLSECSARRWRVRDISTCSQGVEPIGQAEVRRSAEPEAKDEGFLGSLTWHHAIVTL